jgi:hypothetical protein
MAKVGLKVTAINTLTHNETLHLCNEELWVTVCTNCDIVLAAPEQLKCAKFEKAVQDNIFWAHMCRLGFDEVHLLNV